MKPIVKITEYFFQQTTNQPQININTDIQAFQSTLIDCQKCPLCLNPYELDNSERLPRIMIHCGHTFCGECLEGFLIDHKIRCPMCLKLIKQLDNVYFLPINHTIYTKLSKKLGKSDPQKILCTQFTMTTGNRIRDQSSPDTDEQTGLKFCCFHRQKIQHFFCVYHQTPGCRQCMQVRHKRTECKILDLYQIGGKNPLKQK